ncbi:MAG: hypothetical protein QNK36_00435 [Colwellia sp.]|nr:hypothetical protein [Colwellia sp.]
MPIKLQLDQLSGSINNTYILKNLYFVVNTKEVTMIMAVYAHNLSSQLCQRLLLVNQDQLITNGDPIGVTTRKLTICVNLIGASFLIWVDNIARSGLSNTDIPITSALGSLFFLLIMIHTRNTN